MANAKKKPETADKAEPEAKTEPVTESQPEPEVEPAPLAAVKKANPVTMHRMKLEVEVNSRFRITVKNDVTPEDCMDEAFWCHLSTRIIAGDTLVVRPDDTTWELVLHVVNSGSQFVHVCKKAFYELVPDVPRAPLPSLYMVDHAGPIHKWRFHRDGKMMKDGFATESLARRAAQQHEMAVNRAVPK
jgi:hypothetical protein